jgi:mannose-6-phosphate isomerase-like protein (cupin superfamily)|tara:strand:- start:683 stop:1021 length:339 start_codon:yes stop_codon:yes gene_type:complete
MKQGKVWGHTECILSNSSVEVHRIEGKAGHKCSEHKHTNKWNAFYVESGHLIIRIWQQDQGLIDETHLFSGDSTSVSPGLYHQFVVVEDTVAFEYYWSEFEVNDIVRRTSGS